MNILSSIFRKSPLFKGKITLGNFFLKKQLYSTSPLTLNGKHNIQYYIPNTIDSVGRELFITGIYEHKTISVISKLLDKDSVFFDVGANIGAITLPIFKLTRANIHAFEPSEFIFDYLAKNVKKNCTGKVVLNKIAVFSKNNIEVDFYGSETVHGWSTMLNTAKFIKCKVRTITLDEYCRERNIDHIDVLKIDVQGLEYDVLKGCRQLLEKKAIRHILFEFEHWAETNAGLIPGASQEFLLNNCFELFTLQNKKLTSKWTTGTHMIWAKLKEEN